MPREKNGYLFHSFSVSFYLPTNNIGIARYQHHHLFIPRYIQVWQHIKNNVVMPIAKAFYDEMNRCDTPITNQVGALRPEEENWWPSWESFWNEGIHAVLYTNAERKTRIVEWSPRFNVDFWHSYGGVVKVKKGMPRRCPDRCKTTVRFQFGGEQVIYNMFHCDGHLDCKEQCNVHFIEGLMRWENKYWYRPLLITTGLILKIYFKAWGGQFGVYGTNVEPLNVLRDIFNRIMALPNIRNQMILGPHHFGYSLPLKRIDRGCQTDRDPTTDWTHGGYDLPDGRDPHIITIQYEKSSPELSYVRPKPICSGIPDTGEGEGSSSSDSGNGTGTEDRDENNRGGSGDNRKGAGGKSGDNRKGTGGSGKSTNSTTSKGFPILPLIIPAFLLFLLKMRKP